MQLDSERLTLSSLTKAEIAEYAKLVMNEDVMKYITGKALSWQETERKFKNIIEINERQPKIGYFLARKKEDNTMIGLAKLVYTSAQEAELGYSLLPGAWGKKYASEMAKCLIQYARTMHNIRTLIAIVDPENPASIKVLTKQGFRLTKTGSIDGLPAAYYSLDLAGFRKCVQCANISAS